MRRFSVVVIVAGVYLGGPQVVAAADPPTPDTSDALQEVVVSAQKREENLQSVPISVSAISADQLSAAGISDSTQLTAVVPGLSLGVTTANFEPHLRGIGTTSNGPGIENPVALYVDGVYYASQLMGLTDLTDVSQVSVLKGPQGTLFGRNATGGVIQLTTRDPTEEFGGDVRTELDNYLTTRNMLYVTGAVAPGVASNLAAQYATQGEGWGKNIADDKEIHKIYHDVSLRNKWLFTPSDTTTVKLNMDYADLANDLGPNLRPALGTLPYMPGFTPTPNPYDIDSYIDNHTYERRGGASLSVDQDFDFAHLVSICAYRQYDFSTIFAPSVTSVPGLDLAFTQDGKQFTEELQLVSPQRSTFNWVAGAFYFYGHEILDPLQIFLYGPFNTGLSQIDANDGETTRSVAGFAQTTVQVLANTNLTLGLRYTHEERFFSGTETGFVGPAIPIGPIIPYQDEEKDADKLTWRFALDHKFTDDVLGYISYNRGFKSGGFNAFDPTNPPYNPEILDAYEVGLKSEAFDHRLRVNSAAFFYDYKDIQVTRYTNTAVVYNGASARLYGLDIDAEARVTGNLQLNGGLEWIHSYFSSFPSAQFSTPLPGGGAAVYSGDATGNRLPYTAVVTADVGADYFFDFHGGTFDFNVTSAFNSGYFAEPDNYLRQPAFDYLNSSLGWLSADHAWNVKVWGRNMLNKAVPGQLATGAPQGYSADYTNPPRTYGVTVNYAFGSRRH
jgi:iron complex outermembrane recepter protein